MLDWMALLPAFGVGNVTGIIATHFLKRRADGLKRRAATDLATYRRRSTILISTTLAALIRSNRCENDRNELAELIQNLGAGEHRDDFLDPGVGRAWARLIDKSAECGWKRLAGTITELDIDAYSRIRQDWERAAKKSFGPLPELTVRPSMRRTARREDSFFEEAA